MSKNIHIYLPIRRATAKDRRLPIKTKDALVAGSSKADFSKNVKTEVAAGKPVKQAVAIAYSEKAKDARTKAQVELELDKVDEEIQKYEDRAVTVPSDLRAKRTALQKEYKAVSEVTKSDFKSNDGPKVLARYDAAIAQAEAQIKELKKAGKSVPDSMVTRLENLKKDRVEMAKDYGKPMALDAYRGSFNEAVDESDYNRLKPGLKLTWKGQKVVVKARGIQPAKNTASGERIPAKGIITFETEDATNHMGETEYSSYERWKQACRAANPSVRFEGSKDICNALPGVGEWDGVVGVVYKK